MEEVIELEAVPIEDGIEPLDGLRHVIAAAAERAESTAAEYQPTFIEDEEQYAQAKRERTGIRKARESIRADYKAIADPVRTALKDADASMRAALKDLEEKEAGYVAELGAYETRWRANRIGELRGEFEEYAPDLVPLVPFEAVVERFGNDKGAQWTARSVSLAKAAEAMRKAVDAIAADERTIESTPYDEADKEALRADYFRTLDLSGALRRVQAAKEQRERVAELDRQRRERELQSAARRAAEAAEAGPEPVPEPLVNTESVVTPERYAELVEATTDKPEPVTAHQSLVRGFTGAQTVLIALPSVTPKQMERLKSVLGAQGIHGRPCSTGMLLSMEQCADLLTYAKTRAQGYEAPKARR